MVNTLLWLGLMVVFLAAEAATVSLVSLWFAAGALCALLLSMLGAGFTAQLVVFLAVSTILLALLRPLVRKFIKPKIVQTNVNSVVGTVGIVTSDVDNVRYTGEVKLGAMTWTARSTTGELIPAGTKVSVDRIEGVKAFVTPVPVETTV